MNLKRIKQAQGGLAKPSPPKRHKLFAAVLMAVAFVITAGAILTGSFLQHQHDLHVGAVSPRRYKAPREIVNEVATRQAQEEAAASVGPLFKRDQTVSDAIMAKLNSFFDAVAVARVNQTPIYNPYSENYLLGPENESTGPMPQPSAAIIPEEVGGVPVQLSENQFRFLLDADTETYRAFMDKVYEIADSTLDAGVREENMAKSIVAVKDEFSGLDWPDYQKGLGYEVVSSVLAPNLVVDEEATAKAKEEKAAEVEPIVYFAGQKIVDQDEVITAEAYAVLAALGYTETGIMENYIPAVGAVGVVAIFFMIAVLYIYYFYDRIISRRKEILLLFALYVLCIMLARAMMPLPFMFVPITLFVMLAAILLDSRLAIVFNMGLTVVCGVVVSGDVSLMAYFLLTGSFAAILAKYTTERNKILPVAVLVSLMNAITMLAVGFFFDKAISNQLVDSMIYAVLDGLLTVILCIGTLPFWEAVFGIVTPIKMLDMTNPNNPLLRRLTIEAPGTYHHSLIVANLSETAAYDIGANPTLARAGAYFHDIGKLKYPQYFAENQMGENPHDLIDPYTSAQIITGHIKSGMELANEHKLPRKIKDIVEQHHGNSLIKYFYYKATKLYPDQDVQEKDFRYHHNIPQFRESAIVMLADTVEAAVRSMGSAGKSDGEMEAFVRALIKDKLDDGQLADSMLTIKDMDTIVGAFMRVFKGMYHERIPYPKATMAELQKETLQEDAEALEPAEREEEPEGPGEEAEPAYEEAVLLDGEEEAEHS